MADITKIDREDHPHRCQTVIPSQGQCRNVATMTDGGDYGNHCLAHGGNRFIDSDRKEKVRNYRLERFKIKLQIHSDSPHIKDLRDEIAILRMVLEERLNRCNDESDLVLQSGPIGDMVLKIDKVVSSCHKLEGSMGQHLDKSALLQFAAEAVGIIGEEVSDEATIERISNRLIAAIGDRKDESV